MIQTLTNEINNDKAEVLSSALSPEGTLDVVEAASSEFKPMQEAVFGVMKTETCNDERKDADTDKINDNKLNGEKRETFKRAWIETVVSRMKKCIDPLLVHEKEELMKVIEDFKENDSHINAGLKAEKLVNKFLNWETGKLKMNELAKELEWDFKSSSLPRDKITKLKTLINNIHDKRYEFFRSFFLKEQGRILKVVLKKYAMRQNTTTQNTRDEDTQTDGDARTDSTFQNDPFKLKMDNVNTFPPKSHNLIG